MKNKLLSFGLVGTTVTAICCVTPAIPLLFGAIGAASIGAVLYKDAVLFPVLGIFLLVTGFAIWRRQRHN